MIWRGRSRTWWLLVTAFLVVAAFTAFSVVRSIREIRFWNAHADEPIQEWMHIGFVAHSYHVPPYILEQALGLPPGPPPDPRRLAQIAADTGVPFATIKVKLLNAIVHVRPPYPPPGPPPPPQSQDSAKPAVSDTLLGLFADYGIIALFLILVLASAGVPFPSSLMLLMAGSVSAQGDIDPAEALAAAVAGAVIGDQIGYWVARWGGRRLVKRITDTIGGADKVDAAEAFARKWAGAGIFFTRWLVGALGPWINVTSGLSEYPWPRFLLWDVAGELLWVLLYGGLGYIFSDRIQAIAELLGNVSWTIAGLAVTLFLGYRLYLAMRPSTEAKDTNAIEDVPQSA